MEGGWDVCVVVSVAVLSLCVCKAPPWFRRDYLARESTYNNGLVGYDFEYFYGSRWFWDSGGPDDFSLRP